MALKTAAKKEKKEKEGRIDFIVRRRSHYEKSAANGDEYKGTSGGWIRIMQHQQRNAPQLILTEITPF